MNTSTTGAKFKVSGLFKAAYRWLRDEPSPTLIEETPASQSAPQDSVPPPAPASTFPRSQAHAGQRALDARVNAGGSAHPGADMLPMPALPVIEALPAELKTRLKHRPEAESTFSVPVAKIVAQLPLGAVRITFGELRKAIPNIFTPASDADSLLISLPLNEVLPRLGGATLARRPDQKIVEVPKEVVSPFGARGKGLAISTTSDKSSSSSSFTRAPAQASPAVDHGVGAFAQSRGVTPVPVPPSTPPARGVTPGMPSRPQAPAPPSTPALPAAPPAPVSIAGRNGGNGGGNGVKGGNGANAINGKVPPLANVPFRPAQVAAVPLAVTAAPPVLNGSPAAPSADVVEVPLLRLMSSWPQTVRLEIAQFNLMEAKVVFPASVLEKGLRQGKVGFPWKLVRAWIRPELPPQSSPHEAVALNLPLNVVAPLFIARRKPAAKAQRKVAVDETIPNLFFGFPQGDGTQPGMMNAAPVSAPVAAKAPDTNFYTLRDYEEEKARGDQSASAAKPGTDFLRCGPTPNEIVARASAMPGVAGAVVALPDGLAVASRVPASYHSDTLAAFVPQIFGKVSQCTVELCMGSLNNLNFTVGNVPWKIFRVNNIFFAVFGRAEEALPTAQLAALAAELDRKAKAT